MCMREKFADLSGIPPFQSKFTDPAVARTASMDVLQINVGRLCNLACKHCHVEAGPGRTEVMSREVMEACLKAYKSQGFSTIDITGGAPEMNPNFRWFLEEACKICDHVIVRTAEILSLYSIWSTILPGPSSLLIRLPWKKSTRLHSEETTASNSIICSLLPTIRSEDSGVS